MTGAAARDTVLIGATGAYASADALKLRAIAVFIVEIADSPNARRAISPSIDGRRRRARSARRHHLYVER